jgi:hypothetical protein
MVLSNKNTTQAPMTAVGRTGVQSYKFIPAPRVYVKAADPTLNSPVQNYQTKSNGVTPTGWTDLGSVQGNLKLVYDQKTKEVRTGIDNYLRAAYLNQKGGSAEFSLAQTDDVTLEQISGLTASVITAGSVVNYQVGATDMNVLAILFVVQNKLNGKEWQFYHPAAYLTFNFEYATDEIDLKATALLPAFTANGQTTEGFISCSVFA